MSEIYCPILTKALEQHQNQTYCLEERCAWWEEGFKRCAVLSLSDKMHRIANILLARG